MAKIALFVADEVLELIDSVSADRGAFFVASAVSAARLKSREIIDAEIAQWCTANASKDASIDAEFVHTLGDGIVSAIFGNPQRR